MMDYTQAAEQVFTEMAEADQNYTLSPERALDLARMFQKPLGREAYLKAIKPFADPAALLSLVKVDSPVSVEAQLGIIAGIRYMAWYAEQLPEAADRLINQVFKAQPIEGVNDVPNP